MKQLNITFPRYGCLRDHLQILQEPHNPLGEAHDHNDHIRFTRSISWMMLNIYIKRAENNIIYYYNIDMIILL